MHKSHGEAMTKLFFCTIFLTFNLLAEPSRANDLYLRAVDESRFHSCKEVESTAREIARGIQDHVFTVALFPRNGRSLYYPFPAERHGPAAVKWIAGYELSSAPYALFYSVAGAYSFRCRDNQNQILQSTGPDGDPLQLTVATGRATIWHVSDTPLNLARVFVVTDIPLERLDGEQLLAQVKRRLGARFVFLYVRNDAWFLGYSPDSIPYIFTDSVKRITEEEYRATRTMYCNTDQGCFVQPSYY
jgi:hypothetical protein